MRLVADLHIHSTHSRATARDLDLENLYRWAQIKGVQVVATGDFCHPVWFEEINAKLEPAEPGLFRLKREAAGAIDPSVPPICRGLVRFVLVTEISNIYKKDGRTRKNHNLVFAPSLETARRLNHRLENIGNVHSDGRPILGLDARDLLEIVLETSSEAFLVPAHIWTPWFSMLGSKSGFDSIVECFGDLSNHVFAAETGLSSDPSMNWRVSSLDRVALISNSDAHSPSSIGREANLFDIDLSYFGLRDALKSRDPLRFLGTIEFYPEEGKYHLDGHRSCGVRLTPAETIEHRGACPICGKPLTIGVLSRVEELADRPEGFRPTEAPPGQHLIGLINIVSEILQVGAKTLKASQAYQTAIERLGPELSILRELEPDQIESAGVPLLGEAVKRMRANAIEILPGFDGQYGRIRIFNPAERAGAQGQRSLFNASAQERTAERTNTSGRAAAKPAKAAARHPSSATPGAQELEAENEHRSGLFALSLEQRKAVESESNALLIVAGPGSGKTHTLTCRIAHLIAGKKVSPRNVLAVTFTHKAAEEMRSRLAAALGRAEQLPLVATFHALCAQLLRRLDPETAFASALIDEDEQRVIVAEAAASARAEGIAVTRKAGEIQSWIMRAKQQLLSPEETQAASAERPGGEWLSDVYRRYQELLELQKACDYEDLIFRVVKRLETDPDFCAASRERFPHVFVDEYQDLNHGQYRLIRALVPEVCSGRNLCAIGDPDQSIYGFRGSDSSYFRRFLEDYPGAAVVRLSRNYRSSDTILEASFQVIERNAAERVRTYSTIDGARHIGLRVFPDENAEAVGIARIIDEMVGGTGYHSIDAGRVRQAEHLKDLGYSDFAVLARTNEQVEVIADRFRQAGTPCQAVSRRRVCAQEGVAPLISLFRVVSGKGTYADFERIAVLLQPRLTRRVVEAFKRWCRQNRLCLSDGLAGSARFPIHGLGRKHQFLLSGLASGISAMADETAGADAKSRLLSLARHPSVSPRLDSDASREALETLARLADAEGSAAGFLDRLAVSRSDTDFFHPRAQKVAVMSLHAAKGLEFPVVFIAGCEQDLIPFRPHGHDPRRLEEERRLFYVAMTRAKECLYLTSARRRRVFGKTLTRELSPFVADIERRLIQEQTPAGRKRRKSPGQLSLFQE